MSPVARHLVVVLALDRVVSLDLGIPGQVFGAARDAAGVRQYRVTVATPDGGAVRTTGGFRVLPDHGLEITESADTVLVAGIGGGPPLTDGTVDPAVAAALTAAHRRGARVVSICTGAFALAATGLLDGRPAATHWYYVDRFRTLYPRVRLDPDVLFVDDGDILTSAGVAAGIDLCLYIVRRDHGTETANRAARRCVVPAWRDGGQAQYTERPVPTAGTAGTAPTRDWALDRLEQPLTLVGLAAHARMSVRTFTRRFRAETGLSPGRWLLRHRTDRARLLLETTDLGVDSVARKVGLGTAAALRQQFHAAVGVSPTAYRRAFRPPGG